ncbi:hypothetical protein B0H34DRAFT_834532, partial [Crassisporium funariophilum]
PPYPSIPPIPPIPLAPATSNPASSSTAHRPRTLRPRLTPQMPISASILANCFLHPSHSNGLKLLCSCSCRLQSCCRAKPLPHPASGTVRLLLVVRAQMAFEIEPAGEVEPAPGDGAGEVRILFATAVGGVGGAAGGDVLLRYGVGCCVDALDTCRRACAAMSTAVGHLPVVGYSRIRPAATQPDLLIESSADRHIPQISHPHPNP